MLPVDLYSSVEALRETARVNRRLRSELQMLAECIRAQGPPLLPASRRPAAFAWFAADAVRQSGLANRLAR